MGFSLMIGILNLFPLESPFSPVMTDLHAD